MNERRRLIVSLLKLFDLCVVVFAYAVTTILTVRSQGSVSLARFLTMRAKLTDIVIFMLALAACHFVFMACGMYRSRRLSPRRAEMADVARAMTLNTLCFEGFAWLFSIRMITIQFVAIFWLVGVVALSGGRLLLRLIAAQVRVHGGNLRFILILGTNPQAVDFARMISADRGRGYRLLGFVDDDWPGLAGPKNAGFDVVSDFAGLPEFLRKNVVDEVAIYLPFGSFYKHSCEIGTLCEHHGITMRFNSGIFGLKSTRLRAEDFYGHQYITTFTDAAELWPRTVKRILDVVVATTALLFCSPIMLAAAIAIKLSSPGPVLFVQERIGLNKRRFKIVKFRTMVANAEQLMAAVEAHNEVAGPVFKMKNDPRTTPIGKLLRKSSIDELPQLFNVLRGEMSLVGPRPLPVRDYEGFSEDWQRRRFSVKPGITCLWQINGRSSISFDQWMLLDMQYMNEWSVWLDLKILAKTIPAVFRGQGAA